MLADWLGTLSLDEFRATYLGRTPIAQPTTALGARAILDWDGLGRVLAATAPPPDVLVVARGALLPFPAPRDLTELRAYLDDRAGHQVLGQPEVLDLDARVIAVETQRR